jgi:hypothetical protein
MGGGRGGGKTDGLLGAWMHHEYKWGRNARGILLRKHYKQFEEIIRRAKELWVPLGVDWKSTPPTFTWPKSGAQLILRHLEKDDDAEEYQGHSYTFVGADELTNWASPYAIDKMRATLRSAAGVRGVFRGTGNPGGPGHSWVKGRYVDPVPPLTIQYYEIKTPNGETAKRKRVYIPALLEHNQILTQADPDYWMRVVESAAGNPALIQAWRYGLWDIVAGGMFDDLWKPAIHVIAPFEIPPHWIIDRSFDWGSSKPFSVGWWTESNGTQAPNGKTYPRGTLFRIAEWYGWNGQANQGLRMTAYEVGREIRKREAAMFPGREIKPGPADPSIFSTQDGHCLADEMASVGVRWESADNSRKSGWDKFRRVLKASLKHPMEEPGFFTFETCRNGFIRTVPVLPRDERDMDDVDSEAEDHTGDESRYRVTFVRPVIVARKLKGF